MVRLMDALVKETAGKGFARRAVPVPVPGPDEVLIRVHAAGICGTDVHLYDWDPWAAARCAPPFVVGHEFAGEVVQLGRGVEGYAEGDRVSGEGHVVCGGCFSCRTGHAHLCAQTKIIGVDRDGCFAEFLCLPAANVWKIDPNLPWDLAAMHDPLGNAMHAISTAQVSGKTALVTGCGPIGCAAVAMARALGARAVIATDISDFKLDLARRMGATHTVNAAREDVVKAVRTATGGTGADVLLEMSGSPKAIVQGFEALRPAGRACLLGIPSREVPMNLSELIILRGAEVFGIHGRRMFETWYQVTDFLKHHSPSLAPLVTHRFPMDRIDEAIEAIRGGLTGKVLLEVVSARKVESRTDGCGEALGVRQ